MRIVDLTHHLEDDTAIYPGLSRPSFRPVARIEADGSAMSEYHLLNRTGTRVDAQARQIAGGDTLDEIPLELLVTDAVTIDVSGRQPGPILEGLPRAFAWTHPRFRTLWVGIATRLAFTAGLRNASATSAPSLLKERAPVRSPRIDNVSPAER